MSSLKWIHYLFRGFRRSGSCFHGEGVHLQKANLLKKMQNVFSVRHSFFHTMNMEFIPERHQFLHRTVIWGKFISAN
jgi:hypothetical protein